MLSSILLRLTLQFVVACQVTSPQLPVEELKLEEKSPASRLNVVMVRPIVLCDDDGENPASIRLPKELVDQVFSKADMEVLYLNPQRWNYGLGRRGEVNLDTIVRKGKAEKTLSRDPRIINLMFVSAIEDDPTFQGRGSQNGNDCFVCLGPEQHDVAEVAFVIAHEIGHCLNLVHAVDDPKVPNDIPNFQGTGSMDARLASAALHDTQRDTILKSPLINKRIHFLDQAEAEKELVDENWEPYLSESFGHMLRYTLAMSPDAPLPDNPKVCLEFAKQKILEFAGEFTNEEKMFLTKSVGQLEDLVGDKWPMVCRTPWNFIKVKPGFYGDGIHTRGLTIFIRPGAIAYMKLNPLYANWVLAHEKIHILQRINHQDFHPFYKQLGYQQFDFQPESTNRLNLKQNTDDFTHRWAFPMDDELYYYATVLEPSDKNAFVKSNRLIPLEKTADGTMKALPAVDLSLSRPWTIRFDMMSAGYEGPNELTAYFANYLVSRYMKEWQPTQANQQILDTAETFFKRIFSIVSDD